MPELPEIEIMRRNLANKIINKKIILFEALHEKILKGDKDLFQQKINNSYFKDIKRYGGLLCFKLASGYYLLVNLYSKGNLVYSREESQNKNIKAVFHFEDNSKLYFVNSGQFGYIQILNDNELKRIRVCFGMDPICESFNFQFFYQLLRNKTTSIKNILINEDLLAGIGAIYADEICLEARVMPDRSIRSLKQSEINRIYVAIRKILKKSIIHGGLDGNYNKFISVYGREGEMCLKCNLGIIKKILVSNRKTFYCPVCQH
ncbi:MAG: DNA-formamidopyrimidine glycosylase family protein [Patescibacteria group bacterium]